VIFTGAGMSTESGIPDFRSPGGVWSRMKPIYFQDFIADEDMRREAWNRAFSGVAGWVGAEPNAGHYAVARLVARGKVSSVITQNVDNLHQASGIPPTGCWSCTATPATRPAWSCGLRHELDVLKQSSSALAKFPPAAIAAGW
jgi:NAD-dependent deacetylase